MDDKNAPPQTPTRPEIPDFWFGLIIGILGTLLVVALLASVPGRCSQEEAVKQGHAEWVPDAEGKAKFRWLMPCATNREGVQRP